MRRGAAPDARGAAVKLVEKESDAIRLDFGAGHVALASRPKVD